MTEDLKALEELFTDIAEGRTTKVEDVPKVGLRYNSGKVRADLIPFDVIWHLSKVLEVGAKKYADRNWELGMSWMSVVGCLMRHLIKFVSGNDIDKETGLPHIDLVMINAVFLSRYFRTKKQFDDRPKSTCELIED